MAEILTKWNKPVTSQVGFKYDRFYKVLTTVNVGIASTVIVQEELKLTITKFSSSLESQSSRESWASPSSLDGNSNKKRARTEEESNNLDFQLQPSTILVDFESGLIPVVQHLRIQAQHHHCHFLPSDLLPSSNSGFGWCLYYMSEIHLQVLSTNGVRIFVYSNSSFNADETPCAESNCTAMPWAELHCTETPGTELAPAHVGYSQTEHNPKQASKLWHFCICAPHNKSTKNFIKQQPKEYLPLVS